MCPTPLRLTRVSFFRSVISARSMGRAKQKQSSEDSPYRAAGAQCNASGGWGILAGAESHHGGWWRERYLTMCFGPAGTCA